MVDVETLRPVIVTDIATDLEYVDIVDMLGFATGHEPTDEQISEAIMADLRIGSNSVIRPEVELRLYGLRLAELIRNTDLIQAEFVEVGENVVTGVYNRPETVQEAEINAEFDWRRRHAWRNIRYTTETTELDKTKTTTIISEEGES